MSIEYDSKRESLAEVIKNSTVNATYVIPDLQRPYVWSPRQVTMLIDSLFRGWPFGSLLLWEVKPDCFQDNEGLPHRPFWQVVDRTNSDRETANSALGQPATYQMVLDGQQRVQSLILALGGDQWGFQLWDADWALDLQDRRVKPSNHWSKASLCVDLQSFEAELQAKQGKVRKIEAGKIIEWAITDPVNGQSTDPRPLNYVYPLETAWSKRGRFIRLSRFWDLVQKDLSESEYRELLEPVLEEHGVDEDARKRLLDPLGQFMKMVENVKTNSFVHALQIKSFKLTPQWSKDDYSDAIVNIFTRLNTAGRTLTREEITLAWLKIGWVQADTDNRTAGQCLADLQVTLTDSGLKIETDEIVRLVSFLWAVEHRSGTLLDSKDLLKGEIIRSMAATVSRDWADLKARVKEASDLIKARDYSEDYGSFNAIIVFMAWYRIVFDRLEEVGKTVQLLERDSLQKRLAECARRFLDRWIYGSQWANVWGDGAVLSFQNFASDLNSIHKKMAGTSASSLVSDVEESVAQMMARVAVKATEQINNIVVRERRRVHAYYPFLWIWHRLEDRRWKNSSIAMRERKKRTSKLEVDHTVADAWWKALVEKETQVKLAAFSGTDEEKTKVAPGDFESTVEAVAFINLIGNCSLLEKSFNISKGIKPMRSFLGEVHEFREGDLQMVDWEEALSLTETLTNPEGATLADIKNAVQVRDALIRKDLSDFIAGTKFRVD